METLLEFLTRTTEIRLWGLNSGTVLFACALAFATLQAWGSWRQTKTIYETRSTAVLEAGFFISLFGLHFAVATQGIEVRSLGSMLAGGANALFMAPIIAGLHAFRGLERKEIALLALMLCGIVAMHASAWDDVILLAIAAVAIGTGARQPLRIWREKTKGALEIRFPITNLANSAVWAAYTALIGNWALTLVSLGFCFVHGSTIALWLRFR